MGKYPIVIGITDVSRLTQLAARAVRSQVREGTFPAPYCMTAAGNLLWQSEEIQAWVREKSEKLFLELYTGGGGR